MYCHIDELTEIGLEIDALRKNSFVNMLLIYSSKVSF